MDKGTIEKVRQFRKLGKTIMEISLELKIPISTVRYWLDDKERRKIISKSKEYFSKLSKEKKSAIYKSRSKYISGWICKKYKTDKEFKEELDLKRKFYYLNSKQADYK